MKTKAKKAILINARENTLSMIEIKSYTDIYEAGKFKIFTAVQIDAVGHMIYCDDEGLINGTTSGFIYSDDENMDEPFHLLGNGVILGTNLRSGASVDADIDLDTLASRIRCFKRIGGMLIKSADRPRIIAS
jgi:hypothetical protein